MTSVLLLSLVLSAPAAAAQPGVVPNNPLAVELPQLVDMQSGMPQQMTEGQRAPAFDPMEIHPEADICFKIRAYIFSTAPVPRLVKETTCGPKRGVLKSIDGAKPELLPLDASGENATKTDSPR